MTEEGDVTESTDTELETTPEGTFSTNATAVEVESEIADMDIESLEKWATGEDLGAEAETGEEDTKDGDPETKEGVSSQLEKGEDALEGKDEDTAVDEPPKKQKSREELETEAANREAFVQRRNQEMGELRKRNRTLVTKLAQEKKRLESYIAENASEDPLGARNAAKRIDQIEEEASETQQAAVATENRVRIEQGMAHLQIDPNTIGLNDIAECLREDGFNPEVVQQSVANPFGMESNWFLSIVQRVRAKQALRVMYGELQKSKASAKARASAQKSTVKRIANAQDSFPSRMNAKSSSGRMADTESMPETEGEVADLSLDELYKLANYRG